MKTVVRCFLAVGAFAFAQTSPAQTPLLHYNFDEASFGAAPALDGGLAPAAPGTFVGPATRTANTPNGASVGALDLTSATAPDHVTAGDVDKLDGLMQLTLTAWINLQGAPINGNRIMAKQVTTGNFDGFSFAFSTPTAGTISADNFQLNLALGGSGFAFNTSLADMGANNVWRFVAVTYDGTLSTGNLMFYNGSEVDSVAPFGSIGSASVGALIAHANEFRVGASSAGTGVSPPEYVDDVRVYGTVLNLAQLEAVRIANVPEPSAGILAAAGLAALVGMSRPRQKA